MRQNRYIDYFKLHPECEQEFLRLGRKYDTGNFTQSELALFIWLEWCIFEAILAGLAKYTRKNCRFVENNRTLWNWQTRVATTYRLSLTA